MTRDTNRCPQCGTGGEVILENAEAKAVEVQRAARQNIWRRVLVFLLLVLFWLFAFVSWKAGEEPANAGAMPVIYGLTLLWLILAFVAAVSRYSPRPEMWVREYHCPNCGYRWP